MMSETQRASVAPPAESARVELNAGTDHQYYCLSRPNRLPDHEVYVQGEASDYVSGAFVPRVDRRAA